jgi:DNA-directed RNA polymerase subunit E'/Rpb7
MFFVATIEKVVRVEPAELGKNLEQKIRAKYAYHSRFRVNPYYRIEQTNVGTCSGTYGYII